MDIDSSYRDAIAAQLSRRLGQALQSGEISVDEISASAQFILDNLGSVKTHESLVIFLSELSRKWPIFTDYLTKEKMKIVTNDHLKAEKIESTLRDQQKAIEELGKEVKNAGN